jgi:hypothetical protein
MMVQANADALIALILLPTTCYCYLLLATRSLIPRFPDSPIPGWFPGM